MNKVRTVIMAGGQGSRLRPFTAVFPKPLMPIGDVPILDIVIRQLRHFGCTDIIVTVGYLAELILTYLGDGGRYGIKLSFMHERESLGTIGPLSMVPISGADSFLVLNGDVLSSIDYEALVRHHRSTGAVATIASYRLPVTIDKGVLILAEDGRINGYVEKPTYYNPVAMGICVFSPEVLQYLSPGARLDVPELIQRLLADGRLVQSYMFDGYWMDIGQHSDYKKAFEEFTTHRACLLHEPHTAPGLENKV